MAKRVWAWLLCMAMLLSLTPVVSMEADAVGSAMPGASEFCDHTDHSGWQAWDKTTSLPSAAGNYYLENNVEISAAWEVTADIHLCLNGHSITQKGSAQRVGNVRGDAELSIYDCTGKDTAIITGGSGTSGAAFNVNRLGKLNLYGGIITGNGNSASGGAIYLSAANDSVKTGGMFNMYGGTIKGNTALNGIVYVAGGKSGYTNTVFNMYGGTITGNSVNGNGGAILAKAYGVVNITGGIITGNTTAAGAAVSVTDNAKLTVSGDTVIAENTNAAKTADLVVADKLYVNDLTGGSNITVQTTADQTDANKVLAVNGKQTASWQAGWVTYMKLDGTETDIGYITSGSGKTFAFGHYHGDQKYEAYNGGANHNLMKTNAGYYYLTADILRSATSSGHLSLNAGGTEQHLCLNGHSFTHRNPDIRLYLIDTGDKLFIEDCTSYRDESGTFVAGTINFGGASDSTVADGSFMQVNKGGFASLENVKVTGFHSTKSPVFRVLGEAANRGTLNLTNVEITNNSSDTDYAVCYANTGATINMTGCVIKNNIAGRSVSVLNLGGDAQVTITDTVITGNTAGGFGTINVSNPKVVCKLQGATQVIGNQGGNLHLQKGDGYVFNLDGLTEGAKVGITLHKDRITEKQMHFTTVLAEGKNPMPYCVSDDDTYKVVLDAQGRLALVEDTGPVTPPTPPVTHTHKLCADSVCTEHGGDVTFTAWDDATKLPEASGNYYLTTDVKLTNRAGLNGVDVKLCLNGHTITPADSYANSRAFYLRSTAKLTLTDCATTPGKISGFTNTPLMFDASCTDAAINLYNIEVSGNSTTKTGSAVILQGVGQFNLYSGKITGNSTTGSGTVYAAGSITLNLLGGEISGNTAGVYAGGLYLEGGKTRVNLTGTKITGNTAGTLAGGIYLKNAVTQLNISGNAEVTGNTAKGAADNLYLAGTTVFTPGKLNEGKQVGIRAEISGRAISTSLTSDVSAGYNSDNADLELSYLDNALFLGAGHKHCVEGAGTCTEHSLIGFTPWSDATKLPETSGKYYLTTDVTVSNRAGLTDVDVTLCLNGHTIKAAESYTKSRAFYLRGTAKLTLTDCAENPGKITGFKASAIMCDGTCTDAQINLYNIEVSGNSNTSSGGAIVMQGTSALNIHSGKITGNTSDISGGALYAAGTVTVNLLGGEITDNTATTSGGGIIGDSNKTVFNLSGTKISGNTAANGGGIILQNRARLEMTGGEVSGNTATANGGGVFISTNSSMAMSGGKVIGNHSNNTTGGISVQTGAKLTLSGDAQITGNTADGSYGGIYVHNLNGGVSVSGNVQISGNTAKDQPANLYLAGTSKFTAGKLGEKGNVGISTGQYFRPVSNETTEDVSAGYFSDRNSLAIIYQDNALFLGAPDGHSHCFCYAGDNHCNHAQVKFAPWESATSLPETGNWYLTQDVTVTNRSGPTNAGLNLCLNGHTITVAENYVKGRAFYMYNAAKLTITDCNEKPGVITGGNEGAVVFDGTCDGAEFNMYNITMSGNSSTTGGGAVLVQGTSTFNMYSGTFTENNAYTILAVDADGNPKLDADGNQTYKSNLGGGAVASSGPKSEINLYGGKLVNNRAYRLEYLKAGNVKAYAGGSGGAIYAKGNLNIYDGVEISGNVAEANGGGILVGGNETTITIHGGKITSNTGGAGGGMICQNRTTVVMNGGEITGNKGTSEGGGVYVSINSQFTMNGGTISGNSSAKDGGGMFAYASVVTLNAGSVKNNKAAGNGGGISSAKGIITVNGEKVDKGVVITIGKDFSVTGNHTEKNAGGIMLNGKTGVLTLDGGAITGNTAKSAAGGVLTQNSSSFVMKSGKISNNTAQSGGGAYISTNTTFKMLGGSITGNSAKGSTGGVHLLRSTGTFSGGTIGYNTAKSHGGAMYLSGATAYLQGTYIVGNTAGKNGGGVITGQATATVNGVTQKFQCKLVLSGSIIEKNKGANGGGVIVQSYTVFDITGGAIRDNEASAAAGGVYVSTNATVNMTGGSVTGNHAVKNGGGLYHMNSTGTYTGGIIDGNTCDGNGAAFLGSGAKTVVTVKGYDLTGCNGFNGSVATFQSKAILNMEDCKFYENVAGSSGTVYISTHSFGNFTNCKFYNNKVAKQAGAIFGAQNSKVTITDCIFTENTAGTDGGAILCRGSFYMTNCQVEGNTAGGNGGGIATGKCGIRGSKFQDGLVLTNVTVTDNISGAQGGGLYLSTGCRTTMTDVEITGNKAALEGGAFWAVDDTTMHNVTATGNTSGGEGYAAWYDYSVFDGHSYFVGVHKISGNIIIKDNEGGDMYLAQEVAMAIGAEGLGEKTHFGITLDAGVLTNRLYGEYDYEGGNQVYTVTYGSRSFTESEYDAALTKRVNEEKQGAETTDILLYVGIGVVALAVIAVAVLLIAKKKKAGNAAESTKE